MLDAVGVAAQPEDGTWAERREIWSLEADGRLRVAITRGSPADVFQGRHTVLSAAGTLRRSFSTSTGGTEIGRTFLNFM
jgi:hypothetical protein